MAGMTLKKTRTHEIIVLGPRRTDLPREMRDRLAKDGHLGDDEFLYREEILRSVIGEDQAWTPLPFVEHGLKTAGWMVVRRATEYVDRDYTEVKDEPLVDTETVEETAEEVQTRADKKAAKAEGKQAADA